MTFSITNTTIKNTSNKKYCEGNKFTHDVGVLNNPCQGKGLHQYECGKVVCGACKKNQDKLILKGVQHYSGIHGGVNGYQENLCWRIQWEKTVTYWRKVKNDKDTNVEESPKNLNTLPFTPFLANYYTISHEQRKEANDKVYKLSKNKKVKELLGDNHLALPYDEEEQNNAVITNQDIFSKEEENAKINQLNQEAKDKADDERREAERKARDKITCDKFYKEQKLKQEKKEAKKAKEEAKKTEEEKFNILLKQQEEAKKAEEEKAKKAEQEEEKETIKQINELKEKEAKRQQEEKENIEFLKIAKSQKDQKLKEEEETEEEYFNQAEEIFKEEKVITNHQKKLAKEELNEILKEADNIQVKILSTLKQINELQEKEANIQFLKKDPDF